MTTLDQKATRAPDELEKSATKEKLSYFKERLFDLQNLLYANNKRSVLIILQGLDAAGKDSTIRHVFSGVNPMGCRVKSFKKPTELERSHDFMWRIYPHLPPTGMIQIFNRSYYEDILVPSVHQTHDEETIEHRYQYINNFEHHLERNGVIILKFFLHLSEEKQNKKLDKRISDPSKRWKFDKADKKEQPNRDGYLEVYEEIFVRCSPEIPWHIVPADQKWYRNFLIAQAVVKRLEALDMTFPTLDKA